MMLERSLKHKFVSLCMCVNLLYNSEELFALKSSVDGCESVIDRLLNAAYIFSILIYHKRSVCTFI